MLQTILAPLDGSAFAEHALPLALALARRARAGIHLVAVTVPLSGTCIDGVVCLPDVEEQVAARQRSYLETLMARLRQRVDVPLTGEVRYGEVATTLCNLVSSGHYGLMVMATHGRSALGRFFLGSIADEVLHHVNLPLLLVRPETEAPNLLAEPDIGRVVLPLDGSELAERILEPAIALAALIPGTEVVLVRAVRATGPEDAADVEDSLPWQDAERYLAGVAARLEARGVRVRTHVVFEDKPADAILQEAENVHAGLIALATHGRAGLVRLLLGSVADKVVHGTHVPVLVQPADKK